MNSSTETSTVPVVDDLIPTPPGTALKDSPLLLTNSDDTKVEVREPIVLSDRYAAGLLDGEGSFIITTYRDPHGGRHYAARVQVSNTNHYILTCLQRTYGGFVGSNGKRRVRSKLAKKWTITGEKMEDMLKRIYPSLVIKKEVALVVRKFQRYRARPSRTLIGLARYRRKVRAMNRRGL